MATAETPTSQRLLTIEEYAKLPEGPRPTELVRGRVVELNVPKPWHGFVCGRATRIFGNFAEQHDLGIVTCNDSGVITERDPDTLRGGDVVYYSFKRVPKGTLPKKTYLETPPDMVVEVRSSDTRWKTILKKVAEYLDVGVTVVCVLDPDSSTARLYEADQPERKLGPDETLTLPSVLPGLSVPVKSFFE